VAALRMFIEDLVVVKLDATASATEHIALEHIVVLSFDYFDN
jgi:hypothetical protein